MSFERIESNISLHGLGFIQVQLQANQRLHVWHPALPRRKCFADSIIHDHRFSFVSKVLVGSMRNHNYEEFRNHGDYIAYAHEGKREAHGGRPWDFDYRCQLNHMNYTDVLAGEQYRMEAYKPHRTEPLGDGRVATLMTKIDEGTRGAHSYCAARTQPEADFDRFQVPDAILWEYVCEVLDSRTT